jgi:hypothetical protein
MDGAAATRLTMPANRARVKKLFIALCSHETIMNAHWQLKKNPC